MIRFFGLLLAFLIIVPLIRMVMGALGRLFTSYALQGSGGKKRSPQAPVGGTLHKDPVCGTFVSEAVAVKQVARGQTHYFCSEECRGKFLQKV